MGTCIISEVISQVSGLRIHHIVIAEQLITSTDIRLVNLLTGRVLTVQDINEREVIRVRVAHVVQI